MKIDLNLKCGGKVTRVEVLRDNKVVESTSMNSPNHIVSCGRDYLCTWRGDNSAPTKGSTALGEPYYSSFYGVFSGLNCLFGMPNTRTNNSDYSYWEIFGTTSMSGRTWNSAHGQLGPLTYAKIGTSDEPTQDTDTDLHSPVGNFALANYANNTAFFAVMCKTDNSFLIRLSYRFDINADCIVKEFGTFGRYAPMSVGITSDNWNKLDIYTHSKMFSRSILSSPINVKTGDKLNIIYEFTIQFPSMQEVATQLAGFNCVRSFHLPMTDSTYSYNQWYGIYNNGFKACPQGFMLGGYLSENASNGTLNDSGVSFSQETNNHDSINSSSCFPFAGFTFANCSGKLADYNNKHSNYGGSVQRINGSSALGMSPIAYIDDCKNVYSNWYRQSLLQSDANGLKRNMLADSTTFEHTMDNYVEGTGYRIHSITLGTLKTNRPTVYGIGLMGYIFRFGHYENDTFIAEPISIPAGSSISYKVKMSIANIDASVNSESDAGNG